MGQFWSLAKKVFIGACYILGLIASIITIASIF